jgi:carbamoyl-phosphate synthase large subunit
MEVVYDEATLKNYMERMTDVTPDRPILVDQFLEGAKEVDVDMISDGETYVVGGVMEHIEQAGIHSGDSACSLPPYSLHHTVVTEIKRQTRALAEELGVIGLMNVQFAVKNNEVYVLEVNPRASRTIPFVAKAIGVPLAKLAAKVMAGKKLKDLGFTEEVTPPYYSVKEVVLPFVKFRGVDILLGPEMKSTGEVMGVANDFGTAFMKAQEAAYAGLPSQGKVFLSVKDRDKDAIVGIAKSLSDLGFKLYATEGTAFAIRALGLKVESVKKIQEGSPNALDLINGAESAKKKGAETAPLLIINTPSGEKPRKDEVVIRSYAVARGVPCITTLEGARASLRGIQALKEKTFGVCSVQQYHQRIKACFKKPALLSKIGK